MVLQPVGVQLAQRMQLDNQACHKLHAVLHFHKVSTGCRCAYFANLHCVGHSAATGAAQLAAAILVLPGSLCGAWAGDTALGRAAVAAVAVCTPSSHLACPVYIVYTVLILSVALLCSPCCTLTWMETLQR